VNEGTTSAERSDLLDTWGGLEEAEEVVYSHILESDGRERISHFQQGSAVPPKREAPVRRCRSSTGGLEGAGGPTAQGGTRPRAEGGVVWMWMWTNG
jgi:hypothetical protein